MNATYPQYWKLVGDVLSPIREDITVDIPAPVLTEEEIKTAANLIYIPEGYVSSGSLVYAPANRDVTQCIEITHTDVIGGFDYLGGGMSSRITLMNAGNNAKLTDLYINVTEGFVDAGGPPRISECTVQATSGGDTAITDSPRSCYFPFVQIGNIADHFNPTFLANNGFYSGLISLSFETTGARVATLAYGKMLVYATWRQLELPAAPK